MAKNIMDKLTESRVRVEKDGRELINVPGILALPGVLIAPGASVIGTVAASLLGCNIHLENGSGESVNVGEMVRKTADTVADTAKTASRTVREEMDKAWDAVSADDPEGCPVGKENEEDAAEDVSGGDSAVKAAKEIVEELEKHEAKDVPVIHVENPANPDDHTEL